jgi:hypothetical protein
VSHLDRPDRWHVILGLAGGFAIQAAACGSRPLSTFGPGAQDGSSVGDECSSDQDCPPIACVVAPCAESLCGRGADGFYHCTSRVHPPIDPCLVCDPQCCMSDTACPTGQACISPAFFLGQCGDIGTTLNQCFSDDCKGDGDCTAGPNGVCMATFPRVCAYGACRSNADCNKAQGGICVAEVLTIRGGGGPCKHGYVFCRYPSDPCRTDGDCKGAKESCAPNGLYGASCGVFGP